MRVRRTIFLMVFAVMLISASAIQGRRLAGMAGERHSVVLHEAPPMIVFTSVVLGGFKGLLADVLWLRASLLQDQGRYLELVQLSDWITKLEPGLPDVWAFHAWNMAYNLSVMMPKAEDRWRWVQNGISLLRDKGIVYNPGSPKLCFELGWFFEHKIGGNTDAMHLYYKKKLAAMIAEVVGPSGYMDYSSISADTVAKLSSQFAFEVDSMKEVDELYGPLDWRFPQASAVYWGRQGVKIAADDHYAACDRMIYQSMMAVFRSGKLYCDPAKDQYETSFNPGVLPGVIKAFGDAMGRHPHDTSISDSYGSFLREAVHRLHDSGLDEDAKSLFLKLSQERAGPDTAGGYERFLEYRYES